MKPVFYQNSNKNNKKSHIDLFRFEAFNNESGNQAKFTEKEDRQKVTNANIHPSKSVGKISGKFQIQTFNIKGDFQGTGTLIGERLVLTCAHVISITRDINKKKISFISNQIYFSPGNNGKKIKVINYWINEKYFSTLTLDKAKYDFALLELEPNQIIKKDQVIKLNFNYKFQEMKQKLINITRYPENQMIQLKAQSLAKKQQYGLLYYKITTEQGNSGGPVFLKVGQSEYQMIGVHRGSQKNHNYCVLLENFILAKYSIAEILQNHNLEDSLKQIYQPSTKKKIQQLQYQIYSLKQLNEQLRNQNIQLKLELSQKIDKIKANQNQNQILYQNALINFEKDDQNAKQIKRYLFSKYNKDLQRVNKSYTMIKDSKSLSPQKWKQHFNIQVQPNSYQLSLIGINFSMQQFLSSKFKYDHVQSLILSELKLNDYDWNLLSQNGHRFSNLKALQVHHNQIASIKRNQVQKFRKLKFIRFQCNKFNENTVKELKNYKKSHPKVIIWVTRVNGQKQQWD